MILPKPSTFLSSPLSPPSKKLPKVVPNRPQQMKEQLLESSRIRASGFPSILLRLPGPAHETHLRKLDAAVEEGRNLLKSVAEISQMHGRIKTPESAKKIRDHLSWLEQAPVLVPENASLQQKSTFWKEQEAGTKGSPKASPRNVAAAKNKQQNPVEEYVLYTKSQRLQKIIANILPTVVQTERKKTKHIEKLCTSPKYVVLQKYLKRVLAREIAVKSQNDGYIRENIDKIVDDVEKTTSLCLESLKNRQQLEHHKEEKEWKLPKIAAPVTLKGSHLKNGKAKLAQASAGSVLNLRGKLNKFQLVA